MMLIPGSGDSTTLINLINLISDPSAFENNLKELTQISSEVEEQRKALKAETEDKENLTKTLVENQILSNTLSKSVADYEAKSFALKAAIDAFNSDKASFEAKSKITLDDFSKQKTDLDSREGLISNLEAQAKDLYSKANSENEKAIALRNDYEARLSRLKDVIR